MGAKPLNAATSTFTPTAGGTSWADETASPTVEPPQRNLDEARLDGAADHGNDSGLIDAQYEVEVKLSDLQGDVNSPLYSVSSFEELGM